MINKLKRFCLGIKYMILSKRLEQYDGRQIISLSFAEKQDLLEILDLMHDLDDELKEFLIKAGDTVGLRELAKNRRLFEKNEQSIKLTMLSEYV